MPRQEEIKESPKNFLKYAEALTREGQADVLNKTQAEIANLEKKTEMARELLSTGLSPQAVKRILNLPAEIDFFEDKEQ